MILIFYLENGGETEECDGDGQAIEQPDIDSDDDDANLLSDIQDDNDLDVNFQTDIRVDNDDDDANLQSGIYNSIVLKFSFLKAGCTIVR